ncbi:D-alanine--D-alanine ligase family protein [Kosmotoga pacifica]|uniref:D-alanine--D-alanine ligase n=1 Tax=Kosmotoga pacifica TaxID=1330330 RepID=A0A0G2ZBL1_9BACT|nr:D-alanine--D-alanine ligase [Kosmotoga pacifica]AKI96934.1 D-alanyl-alanine synthetase A [Kosmotoga pacifica]
MKEKVAVVYGGFSLERDISLISGKRVVDVLKRLGYQVTPFELNKDNLTELFGLKNHDLVFIALHGKFGEDGRIQSLFDLSGIRYTGSGALASAICFDKEITYRITREITKQPYHLKLCSNEEIEKLDWSYFPAMVKPNSEGSSIGIELIQNPPSLKPALSKGLKLYGDILLEHFITGRELSISVLEINGEPVVLPILEIKPKKRFYDFEAKYTSGLTEFIVPAPLSEKQVEKLVQLSKEVFSILGCRHMIRIDGILSDNEFYFLEVNTIPGLTELSDLPQSAKAMGMTFEELIENVVREALRNKKEVP